MSNQIPVNIEENIHQEAVKVLEIMGLTISDAVHMLLTKIVQEKTLPFDILIFNSQTIDAIKQARNSNLSSVNNVNELMESLGKL